MTPEEIAEIFVKFEPSHISSYDDDITYYAKTNKRNLWNGLIGAFADVLASHGYNPYEFKSKCGLE